MVRRRDVKPWIDASGWVNNEVREGFMEGPNRVIDVLLKNEE